MRFFRPKDNSDDKSANTELSDILRHIGIEEYASQTISAIYSAYKHTNNPSEKEVYVHPRNNPDEPIEIRIKPDDMSITYQGETIYSTAHPERMPGVLAVYLNPKGELGELYKKNTQLRYSAEQTPMNPASQYQLNSANPY